MQKKWPSAKLRGNQAPITEGQARMDTSGNFVLYRIDRTTKEEENGETVLAAGSY